MRAQRPVGPNYVYQLLAKARTRNRASAVSYAYRNEPAGPPDDLAICPPRIGWIRAAVSRTSVSSTVIIDVEGRGRGSCLHVDTGRVPSRHGHFPARQDRSGHAEH